VFARDGDVHLRDVEAGAPHGRGATLAGEVTVVALGAAAPAEVLAKARAWLSAFVAPGAPGGRAQGRRRARAGGRREPGEDRRGAARSRGAHRGGAGLVTVASRARRRSTRACSRR
jgi:hypothetical protein